ncbi:MAG: hypothetical protein OXE77_03105 [Flavobacteriaceae bacterium]|nr:hypothetical protein [Flavobacteriaceae bacterium]MCY4266820.1 hypothetical protein [Flavobacteriaceae bacterium]MCY4298579.1 hypothetical protein [Flavobacteriaceae bacterium]
MKQIRITKIFAHLEVEKLFKLGAEFKRVDKTIIESVNVRKKRGLLLMVNKVQDLEKYNASLENQQPFYSC